MNVGSLINCFFNSSCLDELHKLTPAERIFAYYMYRAAVNGYQVALFQLCPHPEILRKIHYLITKESPGEFQDELKIWWVYLFINYGVHCKREHINNKKVPVDLGLNITREKFYELCLEHNISISLNTLSYLFNKTYKPTATVAKDIESSGSSFYGIGMTTQYYESIPSKSKHLNCYHWMEDGQVRSRPYGVGSLICGRYLTKCLKWILCALEHAKLYPKYFDEHTVKSLDLLVVYLQTGDEKYFREHSKHWLRMNNRVEYNFGLIEYYDDPMNTIGTFQADVTVKAMDMDSLIQLLPTFEERLPFPSKWKRHNMEILPNAAVAHKVIGMGGNGPVLSTVAYCLPNYNDIRSECGSKQVMYTLPASMSIERYKILYLSTNEQRIYEQYSPDLELSRIAYKLMVTLHETIGHASGSNEPDITDEIKRNNLGKWRNALEEMRAEILALYIAIYEYDDIVKSGILEDWPSRIPKEDMFELFIQKIISLPRWGALPEDTVEITQAHALADTGIMYYLIDEIGGMEIVKETRSLKNDDGTCQDVDVLYVHITSLDKVITGIQKLAYLVQEMSSTANGKMTDQFMRTYADSTRSKEYTNIVRNMRKLNSGGFIERTQIFPEFIPIHNSNGDITDIHIDIPTDPYEHYVRLWKLSLENLEHFHKFSN